MFYQFIFCWLGFLVCFRLDFSFFFFLSFFAKLSLSKLPNKSCRVFEGSFFSSIGVCGISSVFKSRFLTIRNPVRLIVEFSWGVMGKSCFGDSCCVFGDSCGFSSCKTSLVAIFGDSFLESFVEVFVRVFLSFSSSFVFLSLDSSFFVFVVFSVLVLFLVSSLEVFISTLLPDKT